MLQNHSALHHLKTGSASEYHMKIAALAGMLVGADFQYSRDFVLDAMNQTTWSWLAGMYCSTSPCACCSLTN